MPRYLLRAKYVGDGLSGLLEEGGTSRRAAVEEVMASVGGRVEAFYFAFGDVDAYVVVEAPDDVSMAAVALTISAERAVALSTTLLLTPEEVDDATKKSATYRAPGRSAAVEYLLAPP